VRLWVALRNGFVWEIAIWHGTRGFEMRCLASGGSKWVRLEKSVLKRMAGANRLDRTWCCHTDAPNVAGGFAAREEE
jgi:hypothetical protein